MNSRRRAFVSSLIVTALLSWAVPASAQIVQPFATGLLSPVKLLAIPGGGLLVSESSFSPNTGRVSLLDRDGRRFTVIEGLPSGRHLLGADNGGPSGLLLTSRRLYIVIGAGDTVIPGAVPGSEILNPNVSSPLFSSVLLLEFPDGNLPFDLTLPSGFTHARIAAGEGIYLRSAAGQYVRVSRLVDFPNSIPEPQPAEPRHVRISNSFGIVGDDRLISVVDASRNLIWSVPIVRDAPVGVLAQFPSVANTNPALGPPVIDSVPASIREAGGDFIVSFLTGFPFGAGAASIWRVNRASGAVVRLAGGLQTAVDVLPLSDDASQCYVIEYSSNFLAGAPGRLVQVDTQRGTILPLATGLITPTSMAKDLRSGELYVTERTGGRVLRVLVPR